jgi:hypothetical protein
MRWPTFIAQNAGYGLFWGGVALLNGHYFGPLGLGVQLLIMVAFQTIPD